MTAVVLTKSDIGYVTPEDFGAKGDFSVDRRVGTNDGPAIQAALNAAWVAGVPCKISKRHYVKQFAPPNSGEIRIPDHSVVVFEGEGGIYYDSTRAPCMFKEGPGSLEMINPKFYFFGTVDTQVPPYKMYDLNFSNFADTILARPGMGGRPNPGNAATIGGFDAPGAALMVLGGRMNIVSPRFESLIRTGSPTDSRSFVPNCIIIFDANDGTEAYGTISNPYFDGVLMGIAGTSWSWLDVINPHSVRYGGLPLIAQGSGYNPPPPHMIYSGYRGDNLKRGILNVINPMDDGINVSEGDQGHTSLKAKGVSSFNVFGGYSKRPHGFIEGYCENWNVRGYYAECDFTTMHNGVNGINPLRILQQDGVINSGYIQVDLKITGRPVSVVTGGGNNLKVDLKVRLDAAPPSPDTFSLWNVPANTTNCHFNVDVSCDTQATSVPLGAYFAGSGCYGNFVTGRLKNFTKCNTIAVLTNGNVGNQGSFTNMDTGEIIRISPTGTKTIS